MAGGTAALKDPAIRNSAYTIAQGLRSLFNKPEIVALLRSGEDESYWRAVLDHSVDGCLQAVLDEYVHVLIESEGLQEADSHLRAADGHRDHRRSARPQGPQPTPSSTSGDRR